MNQKQMKEFMKALNSIVEEKGSHGTSYGSGLQKKWRNK